MIAHSGINEKIKKPTLILDQNPSNERQSLFQASLNSTERQNVNEIGFKGDPEENFK